MYSILVLAEIDNVLVGWAGLDKGSRALRVRGAFDVLKYCRLRNCGNRLIVGSVT